VFEELENINSRPKPFEFYTAAELWTDEHTSKQMLKNHLSDDSDFSSRNSAFIDRSVEWILSRFQIEPGGKIADFGCGPGLYATRLARMQADITGIDFSKRSIQYAQQMANKEGLSIDYVNENYLDYKTDKRFDLILMIFCDFSALSPEQRKKVLGKFHRILEVGGKVLLDVCALPAFGQRGEAVTYQLNLLDGFWSPNDYYGFLNTFKYETEKVMLDKYTIIEPNRTRTVYNWLQYFSTESLKKEFTECGFTVEGLYSDVTGTAFKEESNEIAIIARKQ